MLCLSNFIPIAFQGDGLLICFSFAVAFFWLRTVLMPACQGCSKPANHVLMPDVSTVLNASFYKTLPCQVPVKSQRHSWS